MNGFDEGTKRRRRTAAGGFVCGLLIIAVGTMMLLNTLGIINARNIWAYVPLVFVVFGLIKIFEGPRNTVSTAIAVLMTVGGTLGFLENIGVLNFDKRIFPPLLVIGVGLILLFRAMDRERFRGAAALSGEAEKMVNLWTIFGGVKRFVSARDFRGGDLFAMFGGIELDLRPAGLMEPAALVDANAIFGGVEIFVPRNWSVEVKGSGIFGGYEDQTVHPTAALEGVPRLIITGFAIFGGVTVKNGKHD